MGFFTRDLAEDNVDHHNSFWAVLVFTLLALATFFLPLSPRLGLTNPVPACQMPTDMENCHMDTAPVIFPEYEAKCFTTEDLNDSRGEAVNKACAHAFNLALKNFGTYRYGARLSIYEGQYTTDQFKAEIELLYEKFHNVGTDFASDYTDFLFYKTPLYLFALAACVKLPSVLYILLSSFAGLSLEGFMRDMSCLGASTEGRRAQLGRMARALKKSIPSGNQQCMTMDLYFVRKLLTLIITVAATLTLLFCERETVKDLEKDLEGLTFRGLDHTVKENLSPYFRYPWGCSRSGSWDGGECVFTPVAGSSGSDEWTARVARSLAMYKALWTVVILYLGALSAANLVSLLVWTPRMYVRSLRERLAPGTNYKMDVHFLLHKVRETHGEGTSMELAEAFASVKDDGDDNNGSDAAKGLGNGSSAGGGEADDDMDKKTMLSKAEAGDGQDVNTSM